MNAQPTLFRILLLLLLAACGGGGGEDETVNAFSEENAAAPLNTTARCEDGSAAYATADRSPFILPYLSGQAFNVGQGNCTDGSHSGDQGFAYDFDMPIGTQIVASRSGEVIAAEGRFRDGNRDPNGTNFLIVEHEDGTIAGYYHLTRNGPLVSVGELVAQGQIIALSGDSGDSSEPHLHFEVAVCQDCRTIPVTFSNAGLSGPLEEGQRYTAR